MREMAALTALGANDVGIELQAVGADQTDGGSPRTGTTILDTSLNVQIGVWEMTAGAMTDIEADEVFVVVSGEATVTLLTDGAPSRAIELRTGDICRLEAGMTTLWDVRRTLRKVYIVRAEGEPR